MKSIFWLIIAVYMSDHFDTSNNIYAGIWFFTIGTIAAFKAGWHYDDKPNS